MKKSFPILLLFSLIFVSTNAQWASNGTHIYNTNTGNVGIGYSTPTTLLHVGKNMTEACITVQNLGGTGGAAYSMVDNLSGANWKFKATASGGFKIRDHANSMDVILIENNSIANALYIKSGGNVGIRTTAPVANLHVAETTPGYTAVFGANVSTITDGTNVSIGDYNNNSFLYLGQSTTNKGYLAWNYNAVPSSAYLKLGTNNGANDLILQDAGGDVGIRTATPSATLHVHTNSDNYVRIGDNDVLCNYFYHNEDSEDGDGQATVYAYRTSQYSNDGSGYSLSTANTALKAYNFNGTIYTFGAIGYIYYPEARSGGVLGSNTTGTTWGGLGYRDSGGGNYGGYFTSYTDGTGKSGASSAHIARGIGAWGDLFGADIHGEIYGIFTEGEHFALYSHGTTYKDDLDVHLQKNKGVNTVMYTHVSTDATVQTCGTATLSSGRASISFDPAFTAVVSLEEPVIVTVTPIGESNGVHLDQVTGAGFTVVENQSGKSNVTVNYIAIGKRTGYEKPQLADEVVDPAYIGKLKRGLHNDNNLDSDGEGLYYSNGELIVGMQSIDEPRIDESDLPAAE